MTDIFEFRYEIEPRPWKAATVGKFNAFTPEPYYSFREQLTHALILPYGTGPVWAEDTRFKMDLEIVKKRKNGDRTNLQKAIEDCLQRALIVPNDEAIDDGRTVKRQTRKGEAPYISIRLERIP